MRSVRKLRLMNLIDVRVGLLLQNARQILDIVRGTFPEISFTAAEPLDACTVTQSAGEKLRCLWSTAASLVDVPGQIDTAAALHALTRVSNNGDRVGLHQFDCWSFAVFQIRPRCHEQHCEQLQFVKTRSWYWSSCTGNGGRDSDCLYNLVGQPNDRTMDLNRVHCIWNHDVCEQLRWGRTTLLVLGFSQLAWMAAFETVGNLFDRKVWLANVVQA